MFRVALCEESVLRNKLPLPQMYDSGWEALQEYSVFPMHGKRRYLLIRNPDDTALTGNRASHKIPFEHLM